MLIYYVLFILAVVLGILLRKGKWAKLAYVSMMGAVLFMLSAFRVSTGYDYNLYAGWYYEYLFTSPEELMTRKVEKGFSIPMKYLSDLFYDYQVMFIVIAFVLTLLAMVYIYRYSANAWISVTAFLGFGVFFNSLNFMRQLIAAFLVAYALRYIETKQFGRFLVFVLFASSIHFSALLMLPFFFVLQIPMTVATLGIYSVLAGLTYWKSTDILHLVTQYVYKGYDPTNNVEVTQGLPVGYVLIFAVLFTVAFLLRKDLKARNPRNSILINCAFFALLFEFYGTKHTILSRFALLFYLPPVLLLVSEIVEVAGQRLQAWLGARRLPHRLGTLAVLCSAVILCFGFYQYFLLQNYNGVVPYRSVFSQSDP